MSSSRVWMAVNSCGAIDENVITARFVERIGKIVVETGSGQLFMTPDIAGQLFAQLRELGATIPDRPLVQDLGGRWSERDWYADLGGTIDVLARPQVTVSGESAAVVRR